MGGRFHWRCAECQILSLPVPLPVFSASSPKQSAIIGPPILYLPPHLSLPSLPPASCPLDTPAPQCSHAPLPRLPPSPLAVVTWCLNSSSLNSATSTLMYITTCGLICLYDPVFARTDLYHSWHQHHSSDRECMCQIVEGTVTMTFHLPHSGCCNGRTCWHCRNHEYNEKRSSGHQFWKCKTHHKLRQSVALLICITSHASAVSTPLQWIFKNML